MSLPVKYGGKLFMADGGHIGTVLHGELMIRSIADNEGI